MTVVDNTRATPVSLGQRVLVDQAAAAAAAVVVVVVTAVSKQFDPFLLLGFPTVSMVGDGQLTNVTVLGLGQGLLLRRKLGAGLQGPMLLLHLGHRMVNEGLQRAQIGDEVALGVRSTVAALGKARLKML